MLMLTSFFRRARVAASIEANLAARRAARFDRQRAAAQGRKLSLSKQRQRDPIRKRVGA